MALKNGNPDHKLTAEEQRQGGQKSGEVRREKKTVQRILTELLETSANDMPQMQKLAAKLGIDGEKSVKDIFTLVATLNTLKTAKLDDLEKLTKLLGEDNEIDGNNGILDELAEYLKGNADVKQ